MAKKKIFLILVLAVLIVVGLTYFFGFYPATHKKITPAGVAKTLAELSESKMVDSANIYIVGNVAEISDKAIVVEKDGNRISVPVSKETVFSRALPPGEKPEKEPPSPKVLEKGDLAIGESVSVSAFVTPTGEILTLNILTIPVPAMTPAPEPPPAGK